MNGAPPDWREGDCCFRCRTQFTLVARKHHCRNCGNIFCAKCSSQSIPLPKLNFDKPVRVCDGCYEKVSNKNNDPLTLALPSTANSNKSDDNSDQQQANNKAQKSRSSGSFSDSIASISSKSVVNNNKSSSNASAPSEQELKEEEELQLAIALSLSEATPKVTFPDCRQFEESSKKSASSSSSASTNRYSSATSNVDNSLSKSYADNSTSIEKLSNSLNSSTVESKNEPVNQSNIVIQPLSGHNETINKLDYEDTSTREQQQLAMTSGAAAYNQQYPMQDLHMSERDLEVFRFVAEVQSTSEVFMNRVTSCKLRNRSLVNDSAIQSLFLKLNDMHAKIMDYIGAYEKERASFEALQDKLAQISDARAALEALRAEHQEKIRQEAAEAERQRQSQLALKLEAMRQKKTQMMQHTRELALQRIQAQEIMLSQQSQVPYSQAPATVSLAQPSIVGPPEMGLPRYQMATDQTSLQTHPTSSTSSHQIEIPIQAPPMQTTSSQAIPVTSQPITVPSQTIETVQNAEQTFQTSPTVQSGHSYISLPQMPQFTVPPAQPQTDDDAPLISFDD